MLDVAFSLQVQQDIHLKKSEATPYGQIVVLPSGEIILFNRRAEIIFGWAREEVLGKKIDLLIPDEKLENHIAGRSRWFIDPTEVNTVFPGKKRDGTIVNMEVSLAPMSIIDIGTVALAVFKVVR